MVELLCINIVFANDYKQISLIYSLHFVFLYCSYIHKHDSIVVLIKFNEAS